MARPMRWLGAVLPLLLTGCIGGSSSSAQHVPRFQSARCPFIPGSGMVQGKTVRCGYLVVPEDHAKPTGRTIQLAVAIFKSQSPKRAPDPVVYLNGGPGAATIAVLGPVITQDNAGTILGDRDLILVDQRGTGHSRPALNCPEMTAASNPPLAVQRRGQAAELKLLDAADHRCYDRLRGKGIDPKVYTTPQNAADIADLRRALGYRQVNLYGISYGTSIAQAVMRDGPTGVRSVVLDSVVPPTWDQSSQLAVIGPAFHTLFQGCAHGKICSRQFPHLDQTFYGVVRRLDVHPVVLGSRYGEPRPFLLTGDLVADVIYNSLYYASLIPQLPDTIDAVSHGQYGSFAVLSNRFLQDQGRRSWGMSQSVECSTEAAIDSRRQVMAAARTLPASLHHYFLASALDVFRRCTIWRVGAVSRAEVRPVRSTIPTLILDGQYDPITPPFYGKEVLQTLPYGFRFVFPGVGHGIRFSSSCGNTIIQAFYDQPQQKPRPSCLAFPATPFP